MLKSVNPILILRGINIQELHKRYQEGLEGMILEKDLEREKLVTEQQNLSNPEFVCGVKDGSTFSVRDKNNNLTKVITANTGTAKYCFWCMVPFKELKIEEPIGIPIAMSKERGSDDITFSVEGFYCDTSCAYAKLLTLTGGNTSQRNSKYLNSQVYLAQIHKKMYPNSPDLKAAQDFTLLEQNGGNRTLKQFKDNYEIFLKTPNIRIVRHGVLFSN